MPLINNGVGLQRHTSPIVHLRVKGAFFGIRVGGKRETVPNSKRTTDVDMLPPDMGILLSKEC